MTDVDAFSRVVVGECIRIHRELGPGLLEGVYEAVLASALTRKGLRVARQVPVPVFFDGVAVEVAFRVDILVEDCLILESNASSN